MLLSLAFPALLTLASGAPCPAEVQSRFDNLERSLREVDRALDDIGSRAVRVRLRRKLETVSRRTAEARSEACFQSSAGVPEVVLLPPEAPPPIHLDEPQRILAPILTDADHRALMAAVRGESFKENRVDVLRAGMDGMCLTSSQAKSLVQLFKFIDSKKQALRWMVPRIVDRNKSYQIYSVLKFSSTKSHLKKLLRDTPQHESCVP